MDTEREDAGEGGTIVEEGEELAASSSSSSSRTTLLPIPPFLCNSGTGRSAPENFTVVTGADSDRNRFSGGLEDERDGG